jgi:hypothetical protein
MRQTITRSSKQYAATIPRRRNGETQHEDQRRGPMIPSDKLTLPEEITQRYVFLGRPRRVLDYAALQMGLACSGQALGFVRDRGVHVDREGREMRLTMECVWNRTVPRAIGGASPR